MPVFEFDRTYRHDFGALSETPFHVKAFTDKHADQFAALTPTNWERRRAGLPSVGALLGIGVSIPPAQAVVGYGRGFALLPTTTNCRRKAR